MRIAVTRKETSEGDLVFTITVSEPHHSAMGIDEVKMMNMLNMCKYDLEGVTPEKNKTRDEILDLFQEIKSTAFIKVIENLKFSIENELRPKFRPICQEIYNWIYDHQDGSLKTWMQEFDPQRTKYFFDNDITPTLNNHLYPQDSEHEDEDLK